ncbi:hypothetical protein Tco_1091834 [Tanacetum coccineum]|uniref:Uncharacterized protein n=1 Tax=Tanacetum coccineum TaxID=301880 RepID=A0ABQ5I831_9ASTR
MSQPANDVFSQHLSDDEASFHEDASDNGTASNKPKQQQQQLIPTTTTISNIKLLILKKEEYDIWAMEMEHYLEYIDNDVWKSSALKIHAVERKEGKKPSYVWPFPRIIWRKISWEWTMQKKFGIAIRTSSEGLEKRYDRIQQLLSQLEAHGAEVSTEDANHKFLRSLPPAWSNLAMTMRTKPDVDTLSIDDLYNNLRVFEQELTSTTKSSASAQNVAFVSHNKSSTNKIDDMDIEEIDINWQIAIIAIRMKKFYKKTEGRVRIMEIKLSTSKVGLGYEIKSNDEVLSYEEEMNRTVFNCTEEDFIDKPLYSRFSKTDSFKGVPHPLTRDYTPKPQQEIDESLYVYGKKGPQKPKISDSDDKSNEHSTCQSNDSEGSFGNPSEHSSESESESISVPKEMSMSKNCDFYEKKMAREAELKKQRVFNTGNGVAKPVWNNANRVNHANHFVPRPVQLNTGRANVNSVRQNVNSVRSNVNTGSFNINTVKAKQPINTSNSNRFSPVRPQVNKFNQRSNFSKSHSPVRRPIVRNTAKMSYTHVVKGNWGTAVKTSAGSSTQEHGGQTKPVSTVAIFFNRWMFDIDYLTDSMNYIPVSLDNQTNPYAGTSEMTNNIGTLQTPNTNASEEEDEDEELIVVPTTVRQVGPRKSSTNSKVEEFFTELQNLKTQEEKRTYSSGISEVLLLNLAFR